MKKALSEDINCFEYLHSSYRILLIFAFQNGPIAQLVRVADS